MEWLTEFFKIAGPIASIVASGALALTVWGLKTGRWAQRREDGERTAWRSIEALRSTSRDLKVLIEQEHTTRRSADTSLATAISDNATRITRLEERGIELARRAEENRKDLDELWGEMRKRR